MEDSFTNFNHSFIEILGRFFMKNAKIRFGKPKRIGKTGLFNNQFLWLIAVYRILIDFKGFVRCHFQQHLRNFLVF